MGRLNLSTWRTFKIPNYVRSKPYESSWRTEKFRSTSNESRLFIALIKPHGPVSLNTVSRWIKSLLKKTGINTSIFGAHSTRSAAAYRAVTEGASVGAVLHAGSWAHEVTFNRFYNRAPVRMV